MYIRDKARSDLYLAQLRTQSAPNTPGFAPMSAYSARSPYPMSPVTPRSPYPMSPQYPPATYAAGPDAEEGRAGTQFASTPGAKPFSLQPPPSRSNATPKSATFEAQSTPAPKAPGEQTFESVPIPGAYASPIASPTFAPAAGASLNAALPGQAITTEHRVESPPGSPRLPHSHV
jgi:hypothetical protein